MSLYAKINEIGIVENIIVCEDFQINTQNGRHVKVTDLTGQASVGSSYNDAVNKFIASRPFDSWSLDENFNWVSPVGPSPEGMHFWDEENQEWVAVVFPQE